MKKILTAVLTLTVITPVLCHAQLKPKDVTRVINTAKAAGEAAKGAQKASLFSGPGVEASFNAMGTDGMLFMSHSQNAAVNNYKASAEKQKVLIGEVSVGANKLKARLASTTAQTVQAELDEMLVQANDILAKCDELIKIAPNETISGWVTLRTEVKTIKSNLERLGASEPGKLLALHQEAAALNEAAAQLEAEAKALDTESKELLKRAKEILAIEKENRTLTNELNRELIAKHKRALEIEIRLKEINSKTAKITKRAKEIESAIK